MATSSFLNEDLIMDILSRLPVKSLLRFRCVCKSWKVLIKNPHFINMHLQRNRSKLLKGNAPLLVTSNERSGIRNCSDPKLNFSLISNGIIDDDEYFIQPDSQTFSTEVVHVFGPINGIYCLRMGDGTVRLSNPALRELKFVPPSPRSPDNWIDYGFGFDSNINDFKVVGIAQKLSDISIFVYTLGTNSWRKIETFFRGGFSLQPALSVINSGEVFRWLAYFNMFNARCKPVILSFDFESEVFRMVRLPESLFIPMHIAPLESVVYLLNCDASRYSVGRYEMWVMKEKEIGVNDSWTKLYTSQELHEKLWRPLGIFKNGKILSVDFASHELVSYDPNLQQVDDLHIKVVDPIVYTYMESLVSINGDQ